MEEPEDSGAWARARDLFLDLADMAVEERERALARLEGEDPTLAARVRRLLAADPGAEPAKPASRRFGPYETTRKIAAGGMGEVYLARRADGEFEREVAIKLLRCTFRGDEVLRRFQRERQLLAGLDHEYVARLIDGGTTNDGEPYLVMEYVDGLPLDEYCKRNALDLRARLELFLRLLRAVAHAHERGVVHRDLKPSNVLVRADGSPRLLDFGISRPADDAATPGGPLTRTGHRLFTPEYAAPEQVRGEEVTPATDVFALGVLLYELVSGVRPFGDELPLHRLEQAILVDEPLPPSRRRTGTARRALAGDIDTIALKCLAKAPHERYRDAAELAEDLERALGGYPIRARRAPPWLRAWRLVRRRPVRVVGAAALVAALVLGGWLALARAEGERRRAELVASLEVRLDGAAEMRRRGRLPDARAELESIAQAAETIDGAHVLRARVAAALAVVANHERKWKEALDRLDQADEHLARARVVPPELRASTWNARAFAAFQLGARDEARAVAERSLAFVRESLPVGHELRTDAWFELATQASVRGDAAASEALYAEIIAELRGLGDPMHPSLGNALNNFGVSLTRVAREAEALEALREAQRILGWHLGAGDPTMMRVARSISHCLRRLGRFDEARAEILPVLARYRELDRGVDVAEALRELADLERDVGDHPAAVAHYTEARALIAIAVGDEHPTLRRFDHWTAETYELAGDFAAAREAWDRALAPPHSVAAYGPSMEGPARAGLGRVLLALGETDLARAELERALPLLESARGADHPDTAAVRALLER